MFHPSTTIWHQQSNTNPFNIKERRLVFAALGPTLKAVPAKVGSAVSTMGRITRPFRAIGKLLLLPVTAPARVAIWGVKQGYHWTIKPVGKVASVTSGTIVEGAAGAKDAILNPAIELGKAPLVNLKMNLWDLPKHNVVSAVRLPGDVIRMPKRFYQGHKEMFQDMPTNAKILVKNTRKNLGEVVGNLIRLRPFKTIGSLARTVRDGVNDVLIRPAISHLKPITTPIKPITKKVTDAVKIVYESKKQYLTQIVKATRELVKGLTRIKNAPGHELRTEAIKDIRGRIAKGFKDFRGKMTFKASSSQAPAQPAIQPAAAAA